MNNLQASVSYDKRIWSHFNIGVSPYDLALATQREIRKVSHEAKGSRTAALTIGLKRLHEMGHLSESEHARLCEGLERIAPYFEKVVTDEQRSADVSFLKELYVELIADGASEVAVGTTGVIYAAAAGDFEGAATFGAIAGAVIGGVIGGIAGNPFPGMGIGAAVGGAIGGCLSSLDD